VTVPVPEFGETGERRSFRAAFWHAFSLLAKEEEALPCSCIADHSGCEVRVRPVVDVERLLFNGIFLAERNSVA
jgi:hypothetical protein